MIYTCDILDIQLHIYTPHSTIISFSFTSYLCNTQHLRLYIHYILMYPVKFRFFHSEAEQLYFRAEALDQLKKAADALLRKQTRRAGDRRFQLH